MSKEDLLKQLGNRITLLRKKKGLSLEKLAYSMGLSKGNLSEIEHGKKEPRYCTLLLIAEGMDMTLSELLKGLE